MKTIWYDNQPQFTRGDLVLYYSESGSFNDVGLAGIVDNVSVVPYSDKRKQIIEKSNSPKNRCCGNSEKKQGLNEIIYKLQDGKEISENLILYSGINRVNKLLEYLRGEIKRKQEKIHDIGIAMGLDECDVARLK